MMMIELKVDSDPRVIFECAFLLDEGLFGLDRATEPRVKRKKRGDEERFKIENENIRRSQLSRRWRHYKKSGDKSKVVGYLVCVLWSFSLSEKRWMLWRALAMMYGQNDRGSRMNHFKNKEEKSFKNVHIPHPFNVISFCNSVLVDAGGNAELPAPARVV